MFVIFFRLPLPWFLSGLIYKVPYKVNSQGLFCSIVLLFGMLIFVIIIIAAFKWRMNKYMGAAMFVFYVIFLTLSLLLEYGVIDCVI